MSQYLYPVMLMKTVDLRCRPRDVIDSKCSYHENGMTNNESLISRALATEGGGAVGPVVARVLAKSQEDGNDSITKVKVHPGMLMKRKSRCQESEAGGSGRRGTAKMAMALARTADILPISAKVITDSRGRTSPRRHRDHREKHSGPNEVAVLFYGSSP